MKCFFCKGKLEKGKVNHIVDLGQGVIIIKNVPANVCKQCSEYYLDTETSLNLEKIIENIKANKAEVSIVSYNTMVA